MVLNHIVGFHSLKLSYNIIIVKFLMGKEVRDDKVQRAIESCLLRVLCAFGSQLDTQIVSGQRTDVVRVSCLLQVTVKGSSQQSEVFQLFNCQAASLKHR